MKSSCKKERHCKGEFNVLYVEYFMQIKFEYNLK